MTPPARAFGARSAVGRPASKTSGLVAAGIIGTRSIPGESALRASISGIRPSVSRASGGLRIPIGMSTECIPTQTCTYPFVSRDAGLLRLTSEENPSL